MKAVGGRKKAAACKREREREREREDGDARALRWRLQEREKGEHCRVGPCVGEGGTPERLSLAQPTGMQSKGRRWQARHGCRRAHRK